MQARESRQNQLARTGPFTLLQRFLMDDIANVFDHGGERTGNVTAGELVTWTPKVDVKQRGNYLIISADLPGMDPSQVTAEVTEDAVVIAGRRREEKVDDSGDVYKVERKFGAFFREIPLPLGAIVNQARASFKDGVLEISVPAPPAQAARGRRLEIEKDGAKPPTQHSVEQSTNQQSSK